MREVIYKEGLTVIFRGVAEDKIDDCVRAIYEGGARVLEFTFDPSDKDTAKKTGEIIKHVVDTMGDRVIVGAGTVICKKYLKAAYRAGAKFIVSPNSDVKLIKLTKRLGLVSIPGAFTPSEIMTAYNAGADIIKLFPIKEKDVDYLVNITRPLSHIPFICTGGVNENTIETFISAGAVGVGTGISILSPVLIEKGDFAEITRLTRLHLEKLKKAREKRA